MMMACRMDLWQLRSTTTMSPGATVECQTILFEVEVPLVTKNRWSALKMRAALRSEAATGPVWSSNWPSSSTALQTSARSMFSPKNWWNICPTGRLQEGHAAGMAGAVPGIGAVGGVMGQRPEEWRRQRVEIGLRLAHDMARDELRRVLEHVDEAVQLAQHIVRDVARGARLAVQENRDFSIAVADLGDEGAQIGQRFFPARAPILHRQSTE